MPISYIGRGCGFSSEALADHRVSGIVDVPLAQTGEGIAECELLKWFVFEVSTYAGSTFWFPFIF